jgi:hypothetical protein
MSDGLSRSPGDASSSVRARAGRDSVHCRARCRWMAGLFLPAIRIRPAPHCRSGPARYRGHRDPVHDQQAIAPVPSRPERLSGTLLSQQDKPPIANSDEAALVAHAQCMPTHGVLNDPDPTFPGAADGRWR